MRDVSFNIVLDCKAGITDEQLEQIVESLPDCGANWKDCNVDRITEFTVILRILANLQPESSIATVMDALHAEFDFLDMVYYNSIVSKKTKATIDDSLEKWQAERKFFMKMPPSPIDCLTEMFDTNFWGVDDHLADRLNAGELKTLGGVAMSLSTALSISVKTIENLQYALEYAIRNK